MGTEVTASRRKSGGYATSVPVLLLTSVLIITPLTVRASNHPNYPYETWEDRNYRSPWWSLTFSVLTTGAFTLWGASLLNSEKETYNPEAGWALMFLGLGLGPSTGHLYTNDWHGFIWPSLARILIMGGAIYGVESSKDNHEDPMGPAIIWGYLGIIGVGGLALFSLIDSPFSAVRFNEEHSRRRISISPQIIPPLNAKTSAPAFGITLSGEF